MTTTAPHLRNTIRDYIALTKPRIISLLLVTAVGGIFLASQSVPDPTLVLYVLVGGYLAAGGANAINHYLDRDIDARMGRTSHRPVVSGRITPRRALMFGITLNILAFILLSTLINHLSAYITLSGTLIYVFIYTMALKRSTSQNIVIGGAAGAVPPMVGWTAVTGSLDLPAIYLFAIVFFWTPPHFWALALMIKDDYAAAGIPMLPVVSGVDKTKKAILLYSILLTALTLMFFTTQAVGWIFFTSAAILGAGFIIYSWRLWHLPDIVGAKSTYLYSLAYLALLFISLIADSLIQT